MFGLLTLRQEGVASLAHDGAERIVDSCDRRRPLPCADSSAVYESGVGVSVMTWALKNFSDDLLRVSCHQRRRVYALALLPVERLVDEKVELDVGARCPQSLDVVEDLELDPNVLPRAL